MSASDPGRVPPGAALDQLKAIIDRMRDDRARWAHSYGSSDVVYANVVDDWADELEALRAALDAQPPQAPPWQPIETAPKDGTNVDLWVKTWNAHGDTFVWKRCPNCYWTNGDSMTNHAAHWRNLDSGWYPTHWMLLPDPPVAEGRRAQEQE